MKKEKSCGVICFKGTGEDIKVLLIRHHYGGHWSFPKGHVENNEAEEETALRELLEETGAKAMLIDGYREITTYSPAKNVSKDVVFFVGILVSANLKCQPQEVRELSFVPLAAAYSRLTFASDIQLLHKAEDFYNALP